MQPKNKPLKRRKYDADFKAEVLKMLANNQSAAYIAQALGISVGWSYLAGHVTYESLIE